MGHQEEKNGADGETTYEDPKTWTDYVALLDEADKSGIVPDLEKFEFDMLAMQSYFQKTTSKTTSKAGASPLFAEFLKMKHKPDQSKYLNDLKEIKKTFGEEFDHPGELEEETHGDGTETTPVDGELQDNPKFGDFCIKRKSGKFDTCRSTIKFRVGLWSAVIVVAQLAYVCMIYVRSNHGIDKAYLAIPCAVMVLAIQAMLLIPCYTQTDADKAQKIMLKLIALYHAAIHNTTKQISTLAKHEGFMHELESISTQTAVATQ